jgi:hypothetical protein
MGKKFYNNDTNVYVQDCLYALTDNIYCSTLISSQSYEFKPKPASKSRDTAIYEQTFFLVTQGEIVGERILLIPETCQTNKFLKRLQNYREK